VPTGNLQERGGQTTAPLGGIVIGERENAQLGDFWAKKQKKGTFQIQIGGTTIAICPRRRSCQRTTGEVV